MRTMGKLYRCRFVTLTVELIANRISLTEGLNHRLLLISTRCEETRLSSLIRID